MYGNDQMTNNVADILYKSPPPPPAVVYFFQAGALFSTDNAKFRLILAILSQTYALFGTLFTGLNSA